jgi:Uma2 family endonuclease
MTLRLDREKTWTYEDYLALPNDGQRYEIIDGVLYVTPAPLTIHQTLSKRLQHFFYALELEGKGYAFYAPIDVVMPGCSPVQPDLVFLTPEQRSLIQEKNIAGVPHLLVEILSPSSRSLDRVQKLNRYARNGVSHYLIVDPEASSLEVFVLDRGAYRLEHSLSGDEDAWEFMGNRLVLAALFAPLA